MEGLNEDAAKADRHGTYDANHHYPSRSQFRQSDREKAYPQPEGRPSYSLHGIHQSDERNGLPCGEVIDGDAGCDFDGILNIRSRTATTFERVWLIYCDVEPYTCPTFDTQNKLSARSASFTRHGRHTPTRATDLIRSCPLPHRRSYLARRRLTTAAILHQLIAL